MVGILDSGCSNGGGDCWKALLGLIRMWNVSLDFSHTDPASEGHPDDSEGQPGVHFTLVRSLKLKNHSELTRTHLNLHDWGGGGSLSALSNDPLAQRRNDNGMPGHDLALVPAVMLEITHIISFLAAAHTGAIHARYSVFSLGCTVQYSLANAS